LSARAAARRGKMPRFGRECAERGVISVLFASQRAECAKKWASMEVCLLQKSYGYSVNCGKIGTFLKI
jgi:hypothetical protein